jgi:hypothetical protein
MIPYQTKNNKLAATDYSEAVRKARHIFDELERKTKRRPYIRSVYFQKQKIFFDYFWAHLNQKSRNERLSRLLYLPCGLEVIAKSRQSPTVKPNPNNKDEIFYRFLGCTAENELFRVQIKQSRKTGRYQLMSVFPVAFD